MKRRIATGTLCCAAIGLVAMSVSSAFAAESLPLGRWRTFDDQTGALSGLVEITQSGGQLVGRIVKIIPQPGDSADPVCSRCDGPQKNQRVLGLTILKGFRRDGDEWDGGTILDPRSGYVYSSELRVDDSGKKLFVRGYIGISLIGRTTTWERDE